MNGGVRAGFRSLDMGNEPETGGIKTVLQPGVPAWADRIWQTCVSSSRPELLDVYMLER